MAIDLLGIATIDCFKEVPEENQPTFYIPSARSVVVIASRILPMLSEVAGHYEERGRFNVVAASFHSMDLLNQFSNIDLPAIQGVSSVETFVHNKTLKYHHQV